MYEIREKNVPVCGGVSRFDTLVKSFAAENPILWFSGDLWSPSKCTYFYITLQRRINLNIII